jgi:hypothetical protein
MLNITQKRQLFILLRTENYKASLRLEGLLPPPITPPPAAIATTLAALTARHGR